MFNGENMTTKDKTKITEEMKLEQEIKEKQDRLHKMRYGDMETAYQEFEEAKDIALKKYDAWRRASLKHGRSPHNIIFYFNRIFS